MSKRRKLTIAAVVGAVVVILGAAAFAFAPKRANLPAPSAAFCAAARKYDKKIATLTGKDKFTEQVDLVTPMAEHAPKDVKQDAEVFLDALERRAGGDTSVAKDPKVQQAIENVNRRAAQGCDFYEGDGTSGI
jgi:hypothetical protein